MPAVDPKVYSASPTASSQQQQPRQQPRQQPQPQPQPQPQQRLSVDFGRPPSAATTCQAYCCSPLRRPQLSRNAVSEYSSLHFSNVHCRSGADGVFDEQTDEIISIDDFGDLIDQATFEQVSAGSGSIDPGRRMAIG